VIRVGVVTVTYRGGDAPAAWADALHTAAEAARDTVSLQAVAVDNASGDGTAARLRGAAPWVDVVESAVNGGFAAGCNAGLDRLVVAEVVAFVNPDVRVDSSFLSVLADLPWPTSLGARGPLIVGADGKLEQSARGFPRPATALFGRTSLLARLTPRSSAARQELRADPSAGTYAVDWVSGACLVTTAAVLERLGGFDERYFMYWEDADWCRRAHDAGLRVEYEPRLVAHHAQGSSSRSRRAATIVAFHRSALRYWRRHNASSPASTGLVAAALAARCAVKLAEAGARER